MSKAAFLIAAPQSGSGKTTVVLAIMAALQRRGMAVAPFKCGPDFIDPGYHRQVTGRDSISLDAWMCPEAFVVDSFARHAADADVAVIEGVMGLFDGIGSAPLEGSSAQIAAITGTPVVLVVNSRGMAASAAALVAGFAGFDPRVRLGGVIFNNVGSAAHGELLRQAMADRLPELRVFGCILRDDSLGIPSRHLGLVTADDNPLSADYLTRLADMAESSLDLDGLAELTSSAPPAAEQSAEQPPPDVRIAVARDAAFCFCYPDNLRLLREAGAELVPFSPLADSGLPENIQGIYLPGGYPELHAERLAGQSGLRAAIRTAVEDGMPVYAECGGLIYLSEGMETDHGTPAAAFVGVFPVRTRMLPRRKALGYRQVELASDSLLGVRGELLRGHEFHYSEIGAMPAEIGRDYLVTRRGEALGAEGFRHRNCLASYVHLHFGSNPGIAPAFAASCRTFKQQIGVNHPL